MCLPCKRYASVPLTQELGTVSFTLAFGCDSASRPMMVCELPSSHARKAEQHVISRALVLERCVLVTGVLGQVLTSLHQLCCQFDRAPYPKQSSLQCTCTCCVVSAQAPQKRPQPKSHIPARAFVFRLNGPDQNVSALSSDRTEILGPLNSGSICLV